MDDITSLFNMQSMIKIAKNVMPTVSPITFIYLFLLNKQILMLVLSIISMLFLAFYVNFSEIMVQIGTIKFQSKKLTNMQLGKKITAFLFTDKLMLLNVLMGFIFTFVAFIFLLFNLVDTITWILFFLCLFAGCYYITRFLSYGYVGHKYKKIIDKLQ